MPSDLLADSGFGDHDPTPCPLSLVLENDLDDGLKGIYKQGMSKRTLVIIALLVCVVLGIGAGGYVGWRWFTRDHPAVGVYRMEFPEGMAFDEGVAKVGEVMESEQVMRAVVRDLDLVNRFGLKTEDDAVARVREKLTLRALGDSLRVRVMYRDRDQNQSLEILKAIHAEFIKSRAAQAVLRPAEP